MAKHGKGDLMGAFDNIQSDYDYAVRNGYGAGIVEYVVYRLTLTNMMRARYNLPALTLGAVRAHCGV
jgi:hypothetical protein